jgi:hypothetical protein
MNLKYALTTIVSTLCNASIQSIDCTSTGTSRSELKGNLTQLK